MTNWRKDNWSLETSRCFQVLLPCSSIFLQLLFVDLYGNPWKQKLLPSKQTPHLKAQLCLVSAHELPVDVSPLWFCLSWPGHNVMFRNLKAKNIWGPGFFNMQWLSFCTVLFFSCCGWLELFWVKTFWKHFFLFVSPFSHEAVHGYLAAKKFA